MAILSQSGMGWCFCLDIFEDGEAGGALGGRYKSFLAYERWMRVLVCGFVYEGEQRRCLCCTKVTDLVRAGVMVVVVVE